MSCIAHPNLVKTHITLIDGPKLDIIMPLMTYGSLSQILGMKYPNGIRDEILLATIINDCIIAIKCLHDNHIFHRDVKVANIFLTSEGEVKLGDYGSAANSKNGRRDSFVGSVCWMAPEVAARMEYNHKIDIWSLGITAYEIALGKNPYHGLSLFEIIYRIVNHDPPKIHDEKHSFTDDFLKFVDSCLVKDPQKRPDIDTLIQMNRSFLDKARNGDYLVSKLLKGTLTVQDRVSVFLCKISSQEIHQ